MQRQQEGQRPRGGGHGLPVQAPGSWLRWGDSGRWLLGSVAGHAPDWRGGPQGQSWRPGPSWGSGSGRGLSDLMPGRPCSGVLAGVSPITPSGTHRAFFLRILPSSGAAECLETSRTLASSVESPPLTPLRLPEPALLQLSSGGDPHCQPAFRLPAHVLGGSAPLPCLSVRVASQAPAVLRWPPAVMVAVPAVSTGPSVPRPPRAGRASRGTGSCGRGSVGPRPRAAPPRSLPGGGGGAEGKWACPHMHTRL